MKKILFILAIRAAINVDNQLIAGQETFFENELSAKDSQPVEKITSSNVAMNPAAKENNLIPGKD